MEVEEEEEEPEQKLELSELQTVTDLLKKKRKRSQNNCLVCKKAGSLEKGMSGIERRQTEGIARFISNEN